MKKGIFNKISLLTAALTIGLVIAVIYLMNYVQYLLNEDVRINLTEIVTQNKNVITGNLALAMNNLELSAKQLSDKFTVEGSPSDKELIESFIALANKEEDNTLSFATLKGDSYTRDGTNVNIYGRAYFQLGIKGIPNISDRLISRIDGQDIFVMCVPVTYQDKVVGTILKHYTPQEMYSLCSVSLFSEKGSTYIINSQGYILIGSETSQYSRESDNYYWIMYPTDPEGAKALERDVKEEKSGFMETVIEGRKVFFAYTPIDQIHDWFLISSIDTRAVSPNANAVVKLFYFVLISVTMIFSLTLFYYGRLKRKKRQELEQVAFIDMVTEGDSYTKFTLHLTEVLKNHPEKQFYICSFDIDNFKYINRFYGFERGNQILKAVYGYYKAKLLPDECVARVMADRFVLLLTDISQERLEGLIDFAPVFYEIKIYVSAGLYTITDPEESVSLMVDNAEMAAKTCKGQHFKSLTQYTDIAEKNLVRDEQLKRSVELALQNEEIIAFFQPKVDINTGKLVGAEALARWRSSDGKLIPPSDFIPICEHTGLIALVDMAIFEQTLAFLRSNLEAGVPCVPISVNFSRLHLLNNRFLETVVKKLELYGVPTELIELELTETAIFDNYQHISEFINGLHDRGLKISMDDFGSGYSSLHMLKDIDIDVMKIDRGFLADSLSNERQRIIFGTIVQMADKLNIQVIVEGVETEENVSLMREFGCLYAQGYYFAKPMDISVFDAVFKEGSVCLKE